MIKLSPIQLSGTTCYISRIKDHEANIGSQPFSTFHSIVYKILRRTNIGNNLKTLNALLVGEEMKELVKIALTQLFSQPPTEELFNLYYKHLRNHLNGVTHISTLQYGEQFLVIYENIKRKGLDWEESLQLATWYLENNHVDAIINFKFENLVLLNYDLLLHPRNKNALLFFKALCKWNNRNNAYNIYVKRFSNLEKVSA